MLDKILKEDIDYIIKFLGEKIDYIRNKTILVTGATGLVGSQIVKTLLVLNDKQNTRIKILGLGRNKKKFNQVYSHWEARDDLAMILQDINQEIIYDGKIDFIVHGANTTSSNEYVNNPVETGETIIRGTYNVLNLALKHKVESMVYLSTMEVYGIMYANDYYVDEDKLGYIDILSVRSSYSLGKRMAENICASYMNQYQVPVKIARLSQTFGADVDLDDKRVFAQFAHSIIRGEDIVLHTKGESYGNYCYTRDAVLAILILLDKGEDGQAYNVVNESTNIQIKDMAKLLVDKFGQGKSKLIYKIPEEVNYGYAPDVRMKLLSKKIEDLGWKSDINLEEMYKRLIASYLYRMEEA